MVYTNINRIRFGNKDVNVLISMTGTKRDPQALIIFQNKEAQMEDEIVSGPVNCGVNKGQYCQNKDIAFVFPNAESINSVISALKTARNSNIRKNNVTDIFLT